MVRVWSSSSSRVPRDQRRLRSLDQMVSQFRAANMHLTVVAVVSIIVDVGHLVDPALHLRTVREKIRMKEVKVKVMVNSMWIAVVQGDHLVGDGVVVVIVVVHHAAGTMMLKMENRKRVRMKNQVVREETTGPKSIRDVKVKITIWVIRGVKVRKTIKVKKGIQIGVDVAVHHVVNSVATVAITTNRVRMALIRVVFSSLERDSPQMVKSNPPVKPTPQSSRAKWLDSSLSLTSLAIKLKITN